MMMECVIKVEHVSKVFKIYDSAMDKLKEAFSIKKKSRHRDFYAITDLSFQVHKGEILGIMGRNGAGKSTLLKLLTGIYEPTHGIINVSGKVSSLLELGTGFNMEYTGIENIYFYGTLMGLSKKEINAKVDDIIEFAEIGDYVYQPVKTYSSGMFARLAFSCAINVEPEVLIVDEILSVGDMRFQAKCFNKFKEFKKKGVTILYVGHDIAMMRSFCDVVMWINKGKLVDIGDPTFISAQYTEFMYLDDISEFTDYKLLGNEKNVEDNKNEGKGELREPQKSDIKIKGEGFEESIAHWGSNTGIIKSVTITDLQGKHLRYFDADEIIRIIIDFKIPEVIDVDFLSIAFSIKRKDGIDIVTKATYDEGVKVKREEEQLTIECSPRLANGDYYLVVAVENRKNAAISYYEYIEGAYYFKVYTQKKIFGIYDMIVHIDCK